MNPDEFILYLFTGGAPDSSDHYSLMRRVMAEMKEQFGIGDEIPTEQEKIAEAFFQFLINTPHSKRWVIVIDALNQLEDKDMTTKTAKEVWVPGRNILFLSIASSFADSFEESVDIIFGANKEEGETFPDNTLEFVDKMNETIVLGCLNEVQIIAPFHDYDKKAIISYLDSKKAQIQLSSSCYNVNKWTQDNLPIHCGKCESCLLRLKIGAYDGRLMAV